MNPARGAIQSWSQSQAYDAMVSLQDEDFSKFLDLEDIDLNLSAFGSSNDADAQPLSNQDSTNNGLDTAMHNEFCLDTGFQRSNSKPQRQDTAMDMDQTRNAPVELGNIDLNSYDQMPAPYQAYQDSNYNPRMGVPPTPSSAELHPDAVRYFQQLYIQNGGHVDQRQYHTGKDGLIDFTPLISPEVSTNDSPYSYVPEFTVPGAYLSPLTSPAIEPQNKYPSRTSNNESGTANSSLTASPLGGDFDGFEDDSNIEERPRKTRKKAFIPRSAGPTPQQPSITKGRRRKGVRSTEISAKDVRGVFNEIQPQAIGTNPATAIHTSVSLSRSNSTFNTASPESAPEPSMAPPPKPISATVSPAIMPLTRSRSMSKNKGAGFYPATPASLMRLPSQPQKSAPQSDGSLSRDEAGLAYREPGSNLEDLTLPEAAASRPTVSPSDNRNVEIANLSRSSSQVALARAHSNINPQTSRQSPILNAMKSPTSDPSRSELKSASRGTRKRNGTSSILVSPALRPKISPSIKPLLPDGASSLSSETHALLLASKSNYQNILEGTNPPGVTYPSELSTNLTSKRTSHKLAEQGRRNRINTALQTMQDLLASPNALGGPLDSLIGGSNGGAPSSGAADVKSEPQTPLTPAQQQGNSKAATVEQAIDYIKTLTGKLESRDREIEGLKARLKEVEAEAAKGEASST